MQVQISKDDAFKIIGIVTALVGVVLGIRGCLNTESAHRKVLNDEVAGHYYRTMDLLGAEPDGAGGFRVLMGKTDPKGNNLITRIDPQKLEEARREIERVESLIPDDPMVQLLRLLYYARAEDYSGFDRTFQSLASQTGDPKADAARLVLAARMSREPGRADALFERAMAKVPEDVTPRLAYGMYLHSELKNEHALKVLWEAMATWPDNPVLMNATAHVLIESSEPEKGIDLIRSAIKRRIWSSDMHNTLGVGLSSVDDHHGAAREYRRAIELNPTEPLYFFNLSLALTELKDEEGATKARTEAKRLGLDLSAFGVDHNKPVSRV